MLAPVFERFAGKSPISGMARGIVERIPNPELLCWTNGSTEPLGGNTRKRCFFPRYSDRRVVLDRNDPKQTESYRPDHRERLGPPPAAPDHGGALRPRAFQLSFFLGLREWSGKPLLRNRYRNAPIGFLSMSKAISVRVLAQ